MTRPSTRYVYHPERDQIYEVYFRIEQARVVSRVVRAQGRRGNPVQIWDRITDGEPSALVREIIAICESQSGADAYADASAAMDDARLRKRKARGWREGAA